MSSLSSFFLIVILGILPSIFWLAYYLRKDVHPEPRQIILQLFLVGFLLAPIAGVGEILLQSGVDAISTTGGAFFILLAAAAFWEEGTKYLAARSIFHHEKEFDELTDAMVYLITVALGFAASENIIIMLGSLLEDGAADIFLIIGVRAIGATLLHALASGLLGYFLARTLFLKERKRLAEGLLLATGIHLFFNWFVLKAVTSTPQFTYVVILLLGAGFALLLKDFYNLKRYDER